MRVRRALGAIVAVLATAAETLGLAAPAQATGELSVSLYQYVCGTVRWSSTCDGTQGNTTVPSQEGELWALAQESSGSGCSVTDYSWDFGDGRAESGAADFDTIAWAVTCCCTSRRRRRRSST